MSCSSDLKKSDFRENRAGICNGSDMRFLTAGAQQAVNAFRKIQG